jgi:hypothetical protein
MAGVNTMAEPGRQAGFAAGAPDGLPIRPYLLVLKGQKYA